MTNKFVEGDLSLLREPKRLELLQYIEMQHQFAKLFIEKGCKLIIITIGLFVLAELAQTLIFRVVPYV